MPSFMDVLKGKCYSPLQYCSALLLLLDFLVNQFPELPQDLILSLGAFHVVELGERTLLIGTVNLVFLSQSHGFHTPMSGKKEIYINMIMMIIITFYIHIYMDMQVSERSRLRTQLAI